MAGLLLTPTLAGCGDATSPPEVELNLVEPAEAAGQFETLLAAAEAAGLVARLSSPGPFTVFCANRRGIRSAAGGNAERDSDGARAA